MDNAVHNMGIDYLNALSASFIDGPLVAFSVVTVGNGTTTTDTIIDAIVEPAKIKITASTPMATLSVELPKEKGLSYDDVIVIMTAIKQRLNIDEIAWNVFANHNSNVIKG